MTTIDELVALNPFPGLRPFATSEADRFFGRGQQILELAARLEEVAFIAVAGSSGCGKSSLVRAGLLSELARRSSLESETEWRSIVMRPGSQPIANLAEQLSTILSKSGDPKGSRAGALYGQLKLGGLGLVEAVRLARLNPKTRVLIVVDQFEEIFRFKRMAVDEEASSFVKLLLNAACDVTSPVSVIITLRSDTLGYCADFRGLPEAINRGQYLVPKLTREQRKEAIVGPVELRGFEIARSLVQRVLNDISDDFDDLPVMQHALARTWCKWANASQGNRPIELDDYKTAGTTNNALSHHAEEAFNSLHGQESVVEKVFCALTERLAEGTEQRRPLKFDLLCDVVGGDRTQVEKVVERFRRADTVFLMAVPEGPFSSNPVIDISHESLIRQWPRLRVWAQQEFEASAMLKRLVEAAERHRQNQGSLWRGRDLERALGWRESIKPTTAWVGLYTNGDSNAIWKMAETFLDQSAEENRRDQARSRLLIGGLRIFAIVVVVLSLLTAGIWWKSERLARSGEMANKALLQKDQDPALSAHLALAAVERDPDNKVAEFALRQSLAMLEAAHAVKILSFGAPVRDARYTQDHSLLVVASGKSVTIFDSKTYLPVQAPIGRNENVLDAWLIDDNETLVTMTEDRHVQIQRVDGSDLRQLSCDGEKNFIFAVAVSPHPDDPRIAVGCYDGAVLVFDALATRTDSWSHKVKADVPVTALAFSWDGQYVASGDADGTVNLWKRGQKLVWIGQDARGAKKSPIRHNIHKAISDIGFSKKESNLLLTNGEDVQAIVWSLDLQGRRLERVEKGGKNNWPLAHDRPVIAGKFVSLRGNEASVVTISGKNAQIWTDPQSNPKYIRAHDDWVTDANVSSDGELLVTASSDGTARIWSTRSVTPIATLRGHRGGVNRALFSADGKQVVTASEDGTVRVWQVHGPRLLHSSMHWVLGAAFDPSGTRVAVGGEARGHILEIEGTTEQAEPLDLPGVLGSLSNLSWSKQGQYLLGRQSPRNLYDPTTVFLWDTHAGRDITPEWLRNMQWAVFSPGIDELLTVSNKGEIAVWDMKSLHTTDVVPQPTLIIEKDPLRWMAAMSPDGKWIAASKGDKGQIWRRDDPQAVRRELGGHKGNIQSLQFSPDSKWLLTASVDRTALIWPVDRSDPPKELKGGHSASLSSASFHSNGKLVVTGSADRTIGVWNAETAQLLASLYWHTEGVNSVAFSEKGGWILSASDDGTVKLGQCDACTLSVTKLKERVPVFAQLPKNELEEVRNETVAGTGYFSLPTFLSR